MVLIQEILLVVETTDREVRELVHAQEMIGRVAGVTIRVRLVDHVGMTERNREEIQGAEIKLRLDVVTLVGASGI
jgi:hypothetical protein